jgi:tetrahydromethanopterin S-methyltransferase subunit G
MTEIDFGDRFDRMEKRIQEGFAHVDERFAQVTSRMEAGLAHVNSLIETLANTCAPEFTAINEHFAKVDDRLDAIDGKIEAFARRIDDEVEQRHALGERVSKLEQSL